MDTSGTGGRFVPRRPDHELSADTRARLADILARYADPAVDNAEFAGDAAVDAVLWLWGLPEVERLEACAILQEASTLHVSYPRVIDGEVVGWTLPPVPDGDKVIGWNRPEPAGDEGDGTQPSSP